MLSIVLIQLKFRLLFVNKPPSWQTHFRFRQVSGNMASDGTDTLARQITTDDISSFSPVIEASPVITVDEIIHFIETDVDPGLLVSSTHIIAHSLPREVLGTEFLYNLQKGYFNNHLTVAAAERCDTKLVPPVSICPRPYMPCLVLSWRDQSRRWHLNF